MERESYIEQAHDPEENNPIHTDESQPNRRREGHHPDTARHAPICRDAGGCGCGAGTLVGVLVGFTHASR